MKYIGIFINQDEIQDALNSAKLDKPYVAYDQENEVVDYNSLDAQEFVEYSYSVWFVNNGEAVKEDYDGETYGDVIDLEMPSDINLLAITNLVINGEPKDFYMADVDSETGEIIGYPHLEAIELTSDSYYSNVKLTKTELPEDVTEDYGWVITYENVNPR